MSSDTDTKIQEAFQRLVLGRPEITDGTLTISNICAEAGVSRASYYRSPQAAAIKHQLDTPHTQRPEIDDLRQQVKHLKTADRQLRSENAAEIRYLRETIKTYANQIQALALRADQLGHDNQKLRTSLDNSASNITPLSTARRQTADTYTTTTPPVAT